jgi:heme-degrading monooxygenase HmoA
MVVELHTFRLVDGADEAAFREADHRLQTEFIPNHPGFLRRTTARGPGGEWLVVVLWGSEDAAEASRVQAAGHPVAEAFLAYVDQASLATRRYATLD